MNPLDKAVINTMSETDWQNRLDDLSYYVLRQKAPSKLSQGFIPIPKWRVFIAVRVVIRHYLIAVPNFIQVAVGQVLIRLSAIMSLMKRWIYRMGCVALKSLAIIAVGIWVMFFQIIMSPIRGLDIVLIQQRLYLIKPKAILIYMLSKNF